MPATQQTKGKRTRLSGPARRAQIIDVAATLFSKKGFSGTKTREVARRAGVSEATIFKHFATKDALYAAIIEAKRQAGAILDTAAPVAGERDDVRFFTTLAREMIARSKADPTLMRLLFFSALERHSLSDQFFRSQLKSVDLFLSEYIAERVATGAFRPVEPIQAAWSFIGMVAHHVLLRELFRQELPPHLTVDRIVDEMVTLFLRGVRA
jgi:AcrR family transcriptional regulator